MTDLISALTRPGLGPESASGLDFLGGHPALDLLNTVRRENGAPVDAWQTDRDVMRWLVEHQFAAAGARGGLRSSFEPDALLESARKLRDAARLAIWQRKAGRKPNVAALNAFLARGARHIEVKFDEHDAPVIVDRYARETPEQLLAPLAESVAQLLCDGEFELIKRCENTECTLCFYDRTKSHRRRWCSMTLCGNRQKVAAFRKRKQEAAQDV